MLLKTNLFNGKAQKSLYLSKEILCRKTMDPETGCGLPSTGQKVRVWICTAYWFWNSIGRILDTLISQKIINLCVKFSTHNYHGLMPFKTCPHTLRCSFLPFWGIRCILKVFLNFIGRTKSAKIEKCCVYIFFPLLLHQQSCLYNQFKS